MAAGGNAIRGTRVGAGPMGEQDHGYHADRVAVSYWDALGNETVRYFAAGVPESHAIAARLSATETAASRRREVTCIIDPSVKPGAAAHRG